MEEKETRRKKVWLIIVIILLLLLSLGWLRYRQSGSMESTLTSNEDQVVDGGGNSDSSEKVEIVKCQSVIVSPRVTTELFEYFSGDLYRADYRVSAVTEEESYDVQFLSDGKLIYLWSKDEEDVMMGSSGKAWSKELESKLEEIDTFSFSQTSGDRVCKVWEDGDYVFEVPNGKVVSEFEETEDRVLQEVERVCRACEQVADNMSMKVCLEFLGCR